jgi:phosphoglycerate dehydrogenase-like enzyme
MSQSLIVASARFDGVWPWAADHFHALWQEQGDVEFIRLAGDDERPVGKAASDLASVRRLVSLGVPVTLDCLKAMPALEEATFQGGYSSQFTDEAKAHLEDNGVTVYRHTSEGFWGQTVSEYGLALTLCGLRRMPQLHRQIIDDLSPWNYNAPDGVGVPGARGQQFGDNADFTSGTIAGKRVRVVGAGNIGGRYASFCNMLGADVAVWDPYAPDPCFHRAGARKEWHLDSLVQDAEIFAPMVPLHEGTRNVVTAEHIDALPKGCLVILVTRARICDVDAIRRRVLADEISLSADVWDVEPLPLDDPLLGRHNVVHTPHNAGRTIDANRSWSAILAAQFRPVG